MAFHDDDPDRPRPPRAEPEILPPERWDDVQRNTAPHAQFSQRRIVFAAPGPLGVVLALLGLGAIAAIGIVLLLGLVLLWVPILGALAAGVIIAALLRGTRR